MKCTELEQLVPDFLTGSLAQQDLDAFQQHLSECPACRNEVQELCEIWTKLEVLPVVMPSPALRGGFYAMLEGAKTIQPEQPVLRGKWATVPLRKIAIQLAAAVALVAAGWTMGSTLGFRFMGPNRGNDTLASQQIDLGLLSKPAISKRMLGVALISRVSNPDPSLASALLDVLKNDPSDQVRIAAAETLYQYSDQPWVQEELKKTLKLESSPLVQMAVVDLLKDFMDDGTVDTFRSLVQDRRTSPDVKERILSALYIDPCNFSSAGEYSYTSALTKGAGLSRVTNRKPAGVDRDRSGKRGKRQPTRDRERIPWYVLPASASKT